MLLALELHGLGTADLLKLLFELGLLDLNRHVFLAKQGHLGPDAAIEHGVPILGQLGCGGTLGVFDVQLVAARFDTRLDVLDEIQIGLRPSLVVGLTGHLDVPVRADLVDAREEFTAINEPRLDLLDSVDLTIAQLVEVRFDLIPRFELGGGIDETTGVGGGGHG